MKESKHEKHLKPANMIKREFDLSGKRTYMINTISRANKQTVSEISKFDWNATGNSPLACKIAYETFRYSIDKTKLNLGARYMLERQLSHLLARLTNQHLFHKPRLIAEKVSDQYQANLSHFYTPEELEIEIFKNLNDGDKLKAPSPWVEKSKYVNMIKKYNNNNNRKKKCKYCEAGNCYNPNHNNNVNIQSNRQKQQFKPKKNQSYNDQYQY